MSRINITVTGAQISAQATGPLTSGTVGLPVEICFDECWEGLVKTAVFRAGSKVIDRVNVQSQTTVPWEVMQEKNCSLHIGIYGVNADGTLVIPTVWADVGVIQPGADPSGDESTDPHQPVWQQLQEQIVQNEEKTVMHTPQSLTDDQQEQARENIGAVAQFDEAMLNTNNLLKNPTFQGFDGWGTSAICEIERIKGKGIHGVRVINSGAGGNVFQLIPLSELTSGRYSFHCQFTPDVSGRTIGVIISVIGGKILYENHNMEKPYVEFDLDKQQLLQEYPSASLLRIYISYGWRGYTTVYEPYFGPCRYENSGFYATWHENRYNIQPNPLTGKVIAFNGDSVCEGSANGGGYAKIIGEHNAMTVENRGRSGATVAYSEHMKDDGWYRCISRDVVNMRPDAEYIILEGGVNDLYAEDISLGALSDGYNAMLDDTTVYGAFENMFKQALIRYPGKKIGYIAVHKMGNFFSAESTENSVYHAALQCCAKWGIPVCDLNISCPPFAKLDGNEQTRFLCQTYTSDGDGWHPNEAGYLAYYVPKIEAWLKTL